MNKTDFKKFFKGKRVNFTRNGKWLVLSRLGDIFLPLLVTIPTRVMFENHGSVLLNSKTTKFNPIFRNTENVVFVSYHKQIEKFPFNLVEHGTILIFEK